MMAVSVQPAPGRPWLSVVMPTYCGERWIDAALSSVAGQQGIDGVELLVVDSSPDAATLDLAGRYADRISMRIFDRPDLPSWQSKTNFAIAEASAAHVCWLHQDDVWLPGRVAALRRWVEQDPGTVLHLAPAAIIDTSGRRIGTWKSPLPSSGPISPDLLTARLLVQNFIAVPAPVFRKAAWVTTGGLDEALWYTADWDFWLKLIGQGSTRYHSEVTTGFRVHDGSQTMTGSRNLVLFLEQMERVLARHLPRLSLDIGNVERAARASILVNVALAAAAAGDLRKLPEAAAAVLRLGPAGMHRYIRDSRLMERLFPRVLAKLRGAF